MTERELDDLLQRQFLKYAVLLAAIMMAVGSGIFLGMQLA